MASSPCDLFSLNLLMTFRYCSSASTLSSAASFWLNETSQRGIKRRTTCDRPGASQRPNLVKLGRNLARLLDVIIRGSPCGGRCLMHCKGAERGVAKHSCENLWSCGESWRTDTFRERWIMLLAYVLTPGSRTNMCSDELCHFIVQHNSTESYLFISHCKRNIHHHIYSYSL